MIWFKMEYRDNNPIYGGVTIGYQLFKSLIDARRFAKFREEEYTDGKVTVLGYAIKAEMIQYCKDNEIELSESMLNNMKDSNYYGNKTKRRAGHKQ